LCSLLYAEMSYSRAVAAHNAAELASEQQAVDREVYHELATSLKGLGSVFDGFLTTNRVYTWDTLLTLPPGYKDHKTFWHLSIPYMATVKVQHWDGILTTIIKLPHNGVSYQVIKAGRRVSRHKASSWVQLPPKYYLPGLTGLYEVVKRTHDEAKLWYTEEAMRVDLFLKPKSDSGRNVLITFEPGSPDKTVLGPYEPFH
jgi:hypothetical protein